MSASSTPSKLAVPRCDDVLPHTRGEHPVIVGVLAHGAAYEAKSWGVVRSLEADRWLKVNKIVVQVVSTCGRDPFPCSRMGVSQMDASFIQHAAPESILRALRFI